MHAEPEAATLDLDGEQLVVPRFDGLGLANVAPTILRLLTSNRADVDLPSLDEQVLPRRLIEGVRSVILLVADGLGHQQLEREMAADNAPNLRRLIEQARDGGELLSYQPLVSVFPTTTVAALGSLNSGVRPVDHGLLGYTLYLPELGMVADMIRWGPLDRRISFSDPEFGRRPEDFFWAETLYTRLQAAGVTRTFAVNPSHFAGTALTRMLHHDASYQGYVTTSSISAIVSRIASDSDLPTYIYAYWPTIDTVSHVLGPCADEHGAEVAAFDAAFGRLIERLPRRGHTLVLLTADHGHVETGPERLVPLDEHTDMLGMLEAPPAGERRAVYLHARGGMAASVEAYARERLHQSAGIVTRQQALAAGLFGALQLTERATSRIGDVLLFPRENLQMAVTPPSPPDGRAAMGPLFRGLHGGLAPAEALVPLLALRV